MMFWQRQSQNTEFWESTFLGGRLWCGMVGLNEATIKVYPVDDFFDENLRTSKHDITR